jgi:hypothetical protein
VRAMFLLLWLTIGLAFGGVESPAAAHGTSGYDSVMMLDAHADHADRDGHGNGSSDDGGPCHGLVHHHCSIGLASEGASDFGLPLGGNTSHSALSAAVLSSFAQAPPLQPPSA